MRNKTHRIQDLQVLHKSHFSWGLMRNNASLLSSEQRITNLRRTWSSTYFTALCSSPYVTVSAPLIPISTDLMSCWEYFHSQKKLRSLESFAPWKRIEGAQLLPAKTQFLGCVIRVTTDVCSDVRNAEHIELLDCNNWCGHIFPCSKVVPEWMTCITTSWWIRRPEILMKNSL